jgi:hypothetical protein
MHEACTLLGGVAATTSRVFLGTFVAGATYRTPAFLAKVVTTPDVRAVGTPPNVKLGSCRRRCVTILPPWSTIHLAGR